MVQTIKKGDPYEISTSLEVLDSGNPQIRCYITHGERSWALQGDVQSVTDLNATKGILDRLSVKVRRRHLPTTLRQDALPQAEPTM